MSAATHISPSESGLLTGELRERRGIVNGLRHDILLADECKVKCFGRIIFHSLGAEVERG